MRRSFRLLLCITALTLQTAVEACFGPVVHTKLGSLKGSRLSVKGKETTVYSYLGVPFAKPPVGPLRLARPQPADAWEGVRDATRQPPLCVQDRRAILYQLPSLSMSLEVPEVSEDCLYVNVYTPSKPGDDTKLPYRMLHFRIAVDSYFLPKPVGEIIEKQEFSKVPLITGVTNDEFGFLLAGYFEGQDWVKGMTKEQATQALRIAFPSAENRWIRELVANEYIGDNNDPIQIRDLYREMMGDVAFNIPALKLAKNHKASGSPVYLYEFQDTPSMIKKNRPSFVGVDHTDELFFVQGTCFTQSHITITAPFTKEDDDLCRTVMAYWGNFARTGSPNGPGLMVWPEYGADVDYLGIGVQLKPGKNLKGKHVMFLTETLPELIRLGQEKQEL